MATSIKTKKSREYVSFYTKPRDYDSFYKQLIGNDSFYKKPRDTDSFYKKPRDYKSFVKLFAIAFHTKKHKQIFQDQPNNMRRRKKSSRKKKLIDKSRRESKIAPQRLFLPTTDISLKITSFL